MSYSFNGHRDVYDSAEGRLRKLFEDLKQLDPRFQYEFDTGYIRFVTADSKLEFIVSWVYNGMSLRLKPSFGSDGTIARFDSLYSNYDEKYRAFNWLYPETHSYRPNWKEDLEKECKIIYDCMVDALKKEAEMKRKIKAWEIRRAANVFC